MYNIYSICIVLFGCMVYTYFFNFDALKFAKCLCAVVCANASNASDGNIRFFSNKKNKKKKQKEYEQF